MAKISRDDIDGFFRSVGSAYQCPICRNAVYSINGAGQGEDVQAAVFDLRAPQSFGGHSFYTISCDKCGHTDFFHRRDLDAWVKKKNG